MNTCKAKGLLVPYSPVKVPLDNFWFDKVHMNIRISKSKCWKDCKTLKRTSTLN